MGGQASPTPASRLSVRSAVATRAWSRRAFEDDGDTIVGRVQLSYDDENWQDDLETTYRRVSPRPDI